MDGWMKRRKGRGRKTEKRQKKGKAKTLEGEGKRGVWACAVSAEL